jgi:hypothetical protein
MRSPCCVCVGVCVCVCVCVRACARAYMSRWVRARICEWVGACAWVFYFPFQLLNQLSDFHASSYEVYAIRGPQQPPTFDFLGQEEHGGSMTCEVEQYTWNYTSFIIICKIYDNRSSKRNATFVKVIFFYRT